MHKIISLIAVFICFLVTGLTAQTKLEKHYFKGEYTEALTLFSHQVKEGKAGENDYWVAAKCYEQQLDFVSAGECYRHILTLDSLNRPSLEGLADALIQQGKKNKAFPIYSRLYAADSSDSRIAGKLGSLLLDLDMYATAEKIFTILCQHDSTNIFFNRKLIVSVYKQDNYEKCVQLAVRYLTLNPDDPEIGIVLVNCYQKQNQLAKALAVCSGILSRDSLYLPAISKTGYIFFSNYRNYDQGLIWYRKLNRLEHYSDPFHLKNLGICEYFTGNHEYSAHLLDSLSDELNDDPIIPFYAGLSYKKMGDIDKALLLLERASQVMIPVYASDVYHHLGRAYVAKRMCQEAIDCYQKVIELDPKNYQVLYDMAVTYDEFKLGSSVALTYYEQFAKSAGSENSSDYQYTVNRIQKLKEELFFDGK